MKFAAWAAIGCLILGGGQAAAEVPLVPSMNRTWHGQSAGQGVEDSRVQAVSARLVAVARQFCANQPGDRYERQAPCTSGVTVYESPMPYASTNGYGVRVSTGFVRLAASDDELAFVVAHEMAHEVRGHRAYMDLNLRRRQELEADQLGLVLMAHAGYDPRAAVSLVQRMRAQNPYPSGDPVYLPLEQRAELLRRGMDGLMPASTATEPRRARRKVIVRN